MKLSLSEVDQCEILTLQDNYIDLLAGDNTTTLRRALPLEGAEIRKSLLAEHGFSDLVTLYKDKTSRKVIFDFGFSEQGAAYNADALKVDLEEVEALVLSHGHIDHLDGFRQLVKCIGKKNIPLVMHPAGFRRPRYLQLTNQLRVNFPSFTREEVQEMEVIPVEKKEPFLLLDGMLLFLGEIPRTSTFEKGMPNAYYEENGETKHDDIEDDTAIVANVKGKGLIILSGCAHSGIINTVQYAQQVTGVDRVLVVMGGFHLTGPDYVDTIKPTTDALKDKGPRHVVPIHCTGRNATMYTEKEMHAEFLLNMVGTKLIFSA